MPISSVRGMRGNCSREFAPEHSDMNQSSDDAKRVSGVRSNWSHALLARFIDPCRKTPGRDTAWSIGTPPGNSSLNLNKTCAVFLTSVNKRQCVQFAISGSQLIQHKTHKDAVATPESLKR